MHVKPAVDTALLPHDPPQVSTQVLDLGVEQQQPQLTLIENPPAPEPQKGPIITSGVIVNVKPVSCTALPTQDPPPKIL